LDGTNTDPETMQLREHLENCEACRALKETLQMNDFDLQALNEPAPEGLCEAVMQSVCAEAGGKRPRRQWGNLAIAAGLMLVIGIGAMTLPKNNNLAENAAPIEARHAAAPIEYAVEEEPAYDPEMGFFCYDQTVTVDPQELAEERGAVVVVTHEMLPEMEVCACEVLENGSLLYHLETADAAVQLSRIYGVDLFQPSEITQSAISYALLTP